jgi:hypothetical protein
MNYLLSTTFIDPGPSFQMSLLLIPFSTFSTELNEAEICSKALEKMIVSNNQDATNSHVVTISSPEGAGREGPLHSNNTVQTHLQILP